MSLVPRGAAGLSLLLVSIPALAQAPNPNLVQNGSFEAGYEDTTQMKGGWPRNRGFWAPIGYAGGTDTIPAWTVNGGGVDWHDADSSAPNSMVAADGDRSVDLNSCCKNAPGSISQTIATKAGGSYTMSFSYSGNPDSGCYFGAKPLRATAGSAATVVSADPVAEEYLDGTNVWHAGSLSFQASSSSTVISFESLEDNGTCAGPLVDDVSVVADPVTCPCTSIDLFNSILGNLNYCLDLGGAIITSIDPPVRFNPTIHREAAGGNTPGSGNLCGVLRFGMSYAVLTITDEEVVVCTQLIRDAVASRGVTCTGS